MKILQLCNKPPYPPVDGGTMAMDSITQNLLKSGNQVKVLAAHSYKHPFSEFQLPEGYKQNIGFETVLFHLKPNIFQALYCLFSGQSYHIHRFINKDFSDLLLRVLQEDTFDIIQLESLFMAPYIELIRKNSDAKIVLRSHNVEHQIWKRVAKSTRNPFKKWYIKQLALTLQNYELEHLNDYDGIACISQLDADFFKKTGCKKPIAIVPFGFDSPDVIEVEEEKNSLCHVGSMDWLPNQEGIKWFLNKVWGKVHQHLPQAKLYLAGRKMPHSLMQANYPNVKILGEIPDAMYFIASKQLNIVPLLSGSGIRVKIIEAMSVGKTVLTTPVGAEGINCTNEKNILIAQTPQQFVDYIERCFTDEAFCKQIGEAAHNLILTEYNNEKIITKLIEFYKKLLGVI